MKPLGLASFVIGVIAVLVVLSGFFGSWYRIDETERGVLLRNGAIVGETAIEPGLGFKLPFIDDIDRISVAFQSVRFADPPLESYSYDQQLADLRVSVNYHVPPSEVIKLRKEYIDLETVNTRIVATYVPKVLKEVFGSYTAAVAIQQRTKLNSDFLTALQNSVVGTPIVIDSVQIEDISFSAAYEKSIEDKQLAEVQVQLLQNQQKQAEVNAKTQVINAEAAAAVRVAQATAEAESVRLQGEAQASAIRARGQALGENPSLISLTAAEKWDGALPTSMPPNGTVPFLNLPNTGL